MRKNIETTKVHARNQRQAKRLVKREKVYTRSGHVIEVKLRYLLGFLLVEVVTDGGFGEEVKYFDITHKGRKEALQAFRNTIQKVKSSESWIDEFGNTCLECYDYVYFTDEDLCD